ncbi:MAG: Hpt domain-containing protein [Oceanospirillaceae bacterium]|nr:Hpt domain-containing protein [Oceanospirillaceae bacterium]
MGDRHDYVALDWVKGEIEEVLKQAQYELEAYVESPDDAARMRFCLTYLHQVRGTLQMVEFFGAALLAEEMELVAKAILDGKVSNGDEAREILMQAIIQLPNYLDHIKLGRRDVPVVLLPVLNDLRSARGEALMSETALFQPDLSSTKKMSAAELEGLSDAQMAELLRKLRQMYQLALLGILKGQDIDTQLDYAQKVSARMAKLLGKSPMGQLWQVAAALIEGVIAKSIPLNGAIKVLLKKLEGEFKRLLAEGSAAINNAPAEVLKNFLYYVAKVENDTPRVKKIKQEFNLQESLPNASEVDRQRHAFAGPDKSTLGSVANALIEEIAGLKEKLDVLVRDKTATPEQIAELLPSLKQVSDTMALLALGTPRQVVQEQLELVKGFVLAGKIVSNNELMDIAGALLYVEASLTGLSDKFGRPEQSPQKAQLGDAQHAVLRESRQLIEQVKDLIIEFAIKSGSQSLLGEGSALLHNLKGSLIMVPQIKAAKLAEGCAQVLAEFSSSAERPSRDQLDDFADALAGIEYFIERLNDDDQDDHYGILEKSRLALVKLGLDFPPEPIPVPVVAEMESDDSSEDDDVIEITLESESPADDSADSEPELEVVAADAEEIIVALPEETADLAEISFGEADDADELSEAAFASALDETDEVIEITPVQLENESAAVEAEEQDDLIDDEIIEIFLEEAREVLDTLNEFWPQFKNNRDDKEAFVTSRRAFHTLKGSGRMVNALEIGETAWSIENMLNRVLDDTIALDDNVIGIVDFTMSCIEEMIDAFEHRHPSQSPINAIQAYAHALAKSQPLPAFPGNAAAESVVPDNAAEEIESAEIEITLPEIEQDEMPEAELEITLDDLPEEDTTANKGLDPTLLDIFSSEVETHLQAIEQFLEQAQEEGFDIPLNDELQRALHTLKGSANMAGIGPIGRIAAPMEKAVIDLRSYHIANNAEIMHLLIRGKELIDQGFQQLGDHPFDVVPGTEDFIADINKVVAQMVQSVHDGLDEDKQVDPQVISVFLAEGMDILLDAENILEQWKERPAESALLDSILSELNTLERGAEMADLTPVVALCRNLEAAYQRVLAQGVMPDNPYIDLIAQAHEGLLNMMDQVAAAQSVIPAAELIIELQAGPQADSSETAEIQVEEEIVLELPDETEQFARADDAEITLPLVEQEISLDLPVDEISFELAEEEIPAELPLLETEDEIDLSSIAAENNSIDNDSISFELNDADDSVELPLLELEDEISLPQDAPLVTDIVAAPEMGLEGEISAENAGILDAELVEIFLEEAMELNESIAEALHNWQSDPSNTLEVAQLQRDLHTFKGGARMAEINAIGDLAHELEDLYEAINQGRLQANDAMFDLLHRCHDALSDMTHDVQQGREPRNAQELIRAVKLALHGGDFTTTANASAESADHVLDFSTEPPLLDLESDDSEDFAMPPQAENEPAAAYISNEIESVALSDDDAEIVEIFLDEAEELLEEFDHVLADWKADPENSLHNEAMQRVLHTLKGGARMANLSEVGDIAHDLESELVQRQVSQTASDADFFARLQQAYDLLASRTESISAWLRNGTPGQVPAAPVAKPAAAVVEVLPAAEPDEEISAPEPAANVVALRPQQPVKPQQANTQVAQEDAGRRAAPQEMVKVPANLLDGLVNLAGETSIARGRLEQQVSDFGFTLEEMDATLERLRDQLRRLDMETEAQILFRQERQGPSYEDFDPLEMDRYSQLQQLARSLVESASDLTDIKQTLLDKTRDAETMLLQQSRVNTELQEGLMKTRMVPFSRLVPRLRRIVRQVSQELGKDVEFEVFNPDGEMDRSILERLISPLEHMLRNAVDHGMESAAERAKTGKPASGMISLTLSRDGGDVVLTLADDGKGINREAVRKKAIERGLLAKDAQVSDEEVLQFILQAGFSTAEKVTQISGRGVGMDVVNSEIKQVGGSLAIASQAGAGTQFTIRLPFTVSVNRALMARIGEDLYAIPLNSIDGIVRIAPNKLNEFYEQESPRYSYAGQEYRLDYLGNTLRNDARPKLAMGAALPVVLVRSSTPAALQVDALLGSREIVVKTLGPQFNSVIGVSGGTILGDGSVVIILDLPNLIRHVNSIEYQAHLALERQAEAAIEARSHEQRTTCVLVVDDSVTVRKVTTRLLERQGYEVRTAKDGVDAMNTLQDYKPDVVLLDIEMPRMDGFEVASLMRHDSQLKDIPIIMITSRTGDKHRERAMAIGVTEYMGKPFQEDSLLAAITRVTGREI